MPWGENVVTTAVILSGPKNLSLGQVSLTKPTAADVVVQVAHSGISTGTEKLFWSGMMPPFPGMGYPLVPGYEAAGEVVEAGAESGFRVVCPAPAALRRMRPVRCAACSAPPRSFW
jgi:3-hydroxyethyl bacteriochlorophyllide a dehydrogenase